jgi:hypothetical protein
MHHHNPTSDTRVFFFAKEIRRITQLFVKSQISFLVYSGNPVNEDIAHNIKENRSHPVNPRAPMLLLRPTI